MSRIPTTLFFSKGVNPVPRADLVIIPSAILKKLSVILSEVSLIGINLLDRVLGMTTAGNTERKVGSVMVGSGTHFGGTEKSIVGTAVNWHAIMTHPLAYPNLLALHGTSAAISNLSVGLLYTFKHIIINPSNKSYVSNYLYLLAE